MKPCVISLPFSLRGSGLFLFRKQGGLIRYLTAIGLMLLLTGVVSAAADEGARCANLNAVVKEGLADLGLQKGAEDLCVLTNAPYVRWEEASGGKCLDLISDLTACTMGRGNLLFYHAPITGTLRIVLFRRDTGNAIVISQCGGSTGEQGEVRASPVAATASASRFEDKKINIAPEKIVYPDSYAPVIQQLGSPSEAFSITSILTGWASGAPYDFLRCCELHNHYCPGVTIGYLIGKNILDKYPLSKLKKYVWIGSPAKCGDDAIQILLDLTPGKRSCYIKELTPSQKKAITVEEPLNNVMGILVVWDNAANKGKAVVFKYNWGKVCEISGLKFSDLAPKGGTANPLFWTSRLKSDLAMVTYLDRPSEFVSVAAEVEVTPEMFVKMTSAGNNPYEVIGLTAKETR